MATSTKRIYVVSFKIDTREERNVIFSSEKGAIKYFNLLKNKMKLYTAYNEVRENVIECYNSDIFCKMHLQYYKSYMYSSNDVDNINDIML